jgi:hypothetical protein
VTPGPDLWPDPDAATAVRWDDAPFAAVSALVDPLAVLVALGDLPSPGRELGTVLDPAALHGEEARTLGPGLAWLPASVRPQVPAPFLDPDRVAIDEEPLVRWVLAHATAPASAPFAGGLAAFLWGPAIEPDLPVLPRGLDDGGDALRGALGL